MLENIVKSAYFLQAEVGAICKKKLEKYGHWNKTNNIYLVFLLILYCL